MQQQFLMSDILTVVTGRLYSKMETLYEILDFLTQESLMTHHLPTARKFVKEQLISQLSLAQQDLVNEWEHTENWQEKVTQANNLFGGIFLVPVDKTGFEDYMIENSLLIKNA